MRCSRRHWTGIYYSLQGGQRLDLGSRRARSWALHTSTEVGPSVLRGAVRLREAVCERGDTQAQQSQANGL